MEETENKKIRRINFFLRSEVKKNVEEIVGRELTKDEFSKIESSLKNIETVSRNMVPYDTRSFKVLINSGVLPKEASDFLSEFKGPTVTPKGTVNILHAYKKYHA